MCNRVSFCLEDAVLRLKIMIRSSFRAATNFNGKAHNTRKFKIIKITFIKCF